MRFIHRTRPFETSRSAVPSSNPRLSGAGPGRVDVLKTLRVGDILVGRVTGVFEDACVSLAVRGTQVVAKTTVPVVEGEEVRGLVQAKGPPLVLKVLSENPSQRGRVFLHLRSLLSRFLSQTKAHPAVALVQTSNSPDSDPTGPIVDWLRRFALGENNPPDAQRVHGALVHGGMFFERKLMQWVENGMRGGFEDLEIDLKSVVLRLLGDMKTSPQAWGSLSDKLIRNLETLLGTIELFQTADWIADKEGLGFVFQIPLRFGDDLHTADVLCRPSREKRGKRGNGYRIVLLLDMGGLGSFQIDALLSHEGVAASIGADRQETVMLARAMTAELKKGLEDQGLFVLGIECFFMEKPSDSKAFFQQLIDLDEMDGFSIRV